MLKRSFMVGVVVLAGIGLSACDVDKTQEGNVTVPKYEVEKTQEGSVTAPKYDVTAPEVTVTMEKKTIEVPNIDIDPAKENESNPGLVVKEK